MSLKSEDLTPRLPAIGEKSQEFRFFHGNQPLPKLLATSATLILAGFDHAWNVRSLPSLDFS